MNSIEFRAATAADIELMAEMRIAFIADLLGRPEETVVGELRQNLHRYYSKVMIDGSYLSEIAFDGPTAVSIGGLVFREQAGSFRLPSGRVGYIMNMYTVASHRGRGLGTAILRKLMDRSKEQGVNFFELHATKLGAPVYEKMGFHIHSEPTYRKLE